MWPFRSKRSPEDERQTRPESHRMSLETAHRFLAMFGISQPTRQYERWVKEDGFDFADFPDVLGESPFIISVDWRAALSDELPLIADTLAKLDVELDVCRCSQPDCHRSPPEWEPIGRREHRDSWHQSQSGQSAR